jgi:hypothetical protein
MLRLLSTSIAVTFIRVLVDNVVRLVLLRKHRRLVQELTLSQANVAEVERRLEEARATHHFSETLRLS